MEAVKYREPFLDEELINFTEDTLPCEDGMPMETARHRLQMNVLIEPLELAWQDRQDFYVAGNMFVYFSPKQEFTHDFRGPDVFVVLGVPKRERKSWVVWQEGKAPDVVIELTSASTAKEDTGKKKLIYQNQLRVPEYFLYDPFSAELAGFRIHGGLYRKMKPDKEGRLISQKLHLTLTRWQGWYMDTEALWLRWATLDGAILPTAAEQAMKAQQQAMEAQQQATAAQQQAEAAQQQAAAAQQQAQAAQQQATAAQGRVTELETVLARYQQQFGSLPQ